MIAFKKIFGIWLVLASGTVAAMDSNVRVGKRRILEDDTGVPVAVPVTAIAPVVLAGLARVYDDRAWRMARRAADPERFQVYRRRMAEREARYMARIAARRAAARLVAEEELKNDSN